MVLDWFRLLLIHPETWSYSSVVVTGYRFMTISYQLIVSVSGRWPEFEVSSFLDVSIVGIWKMKKTNETNAYL